MRPDSPQSDISLNSITLVELRKHKRNAMQKRREARGLQKWAQNLHRKKHVFCGSYTAEARRMGSTVQGIHHSEASLHLHTGEEKPYKMF